MLWDAVLYLSVLSSPVTGLNRVNSNSNLAISPAGAANPLDHG